MIHLPPRPEWAGFLLRYPNDTFFGGQVDQPRILIEWSVTWTSRAVSRDIDIRIMGQTMRWHQPGQQGRDLWVPQEIEHGRKEIDR
jgi:hypothetical protein